jgi:hypothetical protein
MPQQNQGLTIAKNKNGFTIARVHYSADPEKAKQEWIAKEKKGMPDWAWRKEFEMDPYAASGKPVFPELPRWAEYVYKPLHHVVKDGVIPSWWPRYAGFDWGGSNPSAFELATISPTGTIIFYWEYYRAKQKPQEINAAIQAHPDWEDLVFVAHDPSMRTMLQWGGGVGKGDREQIKTLGDMFTEFGWPLVPGRAGDDVAFAQALYKAWQNLEDPKVIITHACPKLWWELNHLRHDELNQSQVMKKNEPERIVQKDNHAFDAIKYLIQTHPAGPDGAEIWDSMTKEQKVKYPKKYRDEEEVYDPYLGGLT